MAQAYRGLGQSLIHGTAGNVSVRDGPGMLISPTRMTPDRITAEAVVAMGLGHAVPGASSEWFLHAALYRERPEIGAIVHTHSDYCTALACLDLPLPAFHYMVLTFGGDEVRCAPYTVFGTPELASATVTAMAGRTACLLANHGMITAGADLDAAVAAAHLLEQLARQYLLARSAGTPRILTQQEYVAARARLRSY